MEGRIRIDFTRGIAKVTKTAIAKAVQQLSTDSDVEGFYNNLSQKELIDYVYNNLSGTYTPPTTDETYVTFLLNGKLLVLKVDLKTETFKDDPYKDCYIPNVLIQVLTKFFKISVAILKDTNIDDFI